MRSMRALVAVAASTVFAVAGCTTAASPTPSSVASQAASQPPASVQASASASAGPVTYVRVQLQWVPQAQFAGEFAALDKGFYSDEGLQVTLIDGGPNVVPQQAGSSASGPEFTLAWVPKVLQARESG